MKDEIDTFADEAVFGHNALSVLEGHVARPPGDDEPWRPSGCIDGGRSVPRLGQPFGKLVQRSPRESDVVVLSDR